MFETINFTWQRTNVPEIWPWKETFDELEIKYILQNNPYNYWHNPNEWSPKYAQFVSNLH
jgi:hypothetical protein